MSLEWQAAEGSRALHIIDTDAANPARSGPKSLCGRRPQRNQSTWFALSATDPGLTSAVLSYHLVRCPDCQWALDERARTEEASG